MIRITCSMRVAQNLQSLCAAGYGFNARAQSFHILCQNHSIRLIIIDDQNTCLGQVDRAQCEWGSDRFLARQLLKLKVKPESASDSRCTFPPDLPPHCFDQFPADRETQACPAIFTSG